MDSKQNNFPLEEIIYKPTTQNHAALKPESPKSTSLFLIFAVAIVNLNTFTSGIALGWTSPVLPKLAGNNDNPLGRFITRSEESWIASLPSLGGIVGPFVAGYCSEKLGRKKTLLLFTFLMMVSLIGTAYANTVLIFYMCRLAIGVGVASTFTVLPVYLAEISEDHNRGTVGCSLGPFMSSGLLFAFAVGPFITIRNFCLISAVPSFIFLSVFGYGIPETPHFLASINRDTEVQASLEKFRNKSPDELKREYFEISKTVLENSKKENGCADLLKQRPLRKGLVIILGIILLQQFSGINIVLAYLQTIFSATGSGLAPEISTIIIGVIQIVATVLTSFLVDKIGRKVLLLTSAIGSGLSLISLGAYFYLKDHDFKIYGISWLPVTSLVCYIVAFNIGLGPVPWAIVGELFPSNVRSVAATLTNITCSGSAFGMTLVFPMMTSMLGMAESFWLFSIICMAGAVFIYFVLPETKGRSLQEIQRLLGGK